MNRIVDVIRIFIPGLITTLFFSLNVMADTIGLAEYLQEIKTGHPYFKQQALNADIEREQQRSFLGDEDWVINAAPSYRHDQRNSQGSPFVAEEQDDLALNVGLERTFWSNGSRLSIDYNYYHTDQRYADPVGSFDEHGNGLSLTYSIPLLKNKGGELSRLDYDLQGYNIDLSEVNSAENQEQFLQQQAQLFLDWIFVDEQRNIANNRLALAEEELSRTEKKRRSRLVAEVDVLRARDAVINARQNLGAIDAQWKALQAELATQSGNPAIHQMNPRFDLYGLHSLPPIEQAVLILQQNTRQLRAIDLQIDQLERLKNGLDNELKSELDLILSGGLHDEADEFSGSTGFDQPQYMIGVNYRYPIGQRTAKADVSKVRLQQQQLHAARNSLSRELESQLRNVLVHLQELKGVIELNKEKIEVARLRTKEELNRHNQGRSELSFVIQSRDNEQNAQLTYAANAINYQKLWLSYLALIDELLNGVELN